MSFNVDSIVDDGITVLDYASGSPRSPKIVVIMPADNVLDVNAIDSNLDVQYLYVVFRKNGYIVDGLQPLVQFQNLKEIILLDVGNLHSQLVQPLAMLTSLVSLDLGRCEYVMNDLLYVVLPNLKSLKKLRLECNRNNNCVAYDVLDVVTEHLDQLINLQLVNFTITNGFDFKLGQCRNLQKFLIAPIYDGMLYTALYRVFHALRRSAPALRTVDWIIITDALGEVTADDNEPTFEILESIWLNCLGVSEHDYWHENNATNGCSCWDRTKAGLQAALSHLSLRVQKMPFQETFYAFPE